jgi:DNA-binding beta-propeller fold protein YncE
MYSRHSHLRHLRSTRPLLAFLVRALSVSSAVWAMPACAPQDDHVSDELTAPEAEIRHHPATSAAAATAVATAATSPYTLFESGQVRPLAMSPDRHHLFAVNTPDNRLEVFEVKDSGLIHRASIPVGLEPVAVAARTNSEVWVVNHLSDSVSVIELGTDGRDGRVVRTLLVGDEPRDIVFGGPGHRRAFITSAHRGQNIPFDPQLTTPGVGRHDVWVFDADHLGNTLGGTPITIVTLFSDTPRALAVTPDGSRVYTAAFHSGNRTTSISHKLLLGPGEVFPQLPPTTSFEGIPQPITGLIVKFNGAHWVDETGRVWDDKVKFSLPDKDVFVIDAMADPPAQLGGSAGFYAGVGTILFNMIVNPASGKVYVSNTEARNDARFEGPGVFAGRTLRGHTHESRISVLGAAGSVAPRHLNKHIDYGSCCQPIPNAENARSLAQPVGMAITADGSTLYVAALGSSKVGVYRTSELEADTFVPSTASQIRVSGGGPTGLVLDEPNHRLYALTRFDNAVSIIDTRRGAEIGQVAMHSPEPPSIVRGRRLLYDAASGSSHGDTSCASCHVFGDFDSLAWDLGNPDARVLHDPGPFVFPPAVFDPTFNPDFQPMKGPMVTQSLRGMANHGPMHWRGDRTGGNDAPSTQPDGGSFDEKAAFLKFRVGFTDLLGRSAFIPEADLAAFADFILQVTYPPNPIRNLDDSLTSDQQAGRDFFMDPHIVDFTNACVDCHVLDRNANPGTAAPGFFGTRGFLAFELDTQMTKVPHLRNAYQKVGMFGMAETTFVNNGNNDFTGDQVRGFGFLHDGSSDTAFRFIDMSGFNQLPDVNPGGFPPGPAGVVLRRQVEAFVLAFDSNMYPIVGQQVTLTASNAALAGPRIDLLIARAGAGECDLVVKGQARGRESGFLYSGAGTFLGDRRATRPISDARLRLTPVLPGGGELTYTCVPPGSGARIAIDRDGDGHLDGDEADAGSDPADPASVPRAP